MSDETKKVMIEVKEVNKFFGENHVVHNLNMTIYQGEFLTILGSSGCGKTTILRMIGGFDVQTNGSILLEGTSVEGLEPYKRNVNTVFQSYALFPHMNVYDNIAYGLALKKVKKAEIHEKVMKMLELVQLSGFEKRQISQLSGGQKQRIAIARALINEPRVLLLDEPLGALDLQLRKQMQVELKRLQRKLGITFIYVTHDQEEALSMSDRIAIMNGGFLEQIGKPKEIYQKPLTKFVADFIGETNTFSCYVADEIKKDTKVLLETGSAMVSGEGLEPKQMVYVSVRPEKMKYSYEKVDGFSLKAVAKEVLYIGTVFKCILEMNDGKEIKINVNSEEEVPTLGKGVYLYWDISDAVVIYAKDNKIYNAVEKMNLTTEERVSVHG